jgi:hypothetical protein
MGGGLLNLTQVAEKMFWHTAQILNLDMGTLKPAASEVAIRAIETLLKEAVANAVEEARFETDDKWRARESECLVESRKTIAFLENKVKEAKQEAYRICAEIAEKDDSHSHDCVQHMGDQRGEGGCICEATRIAGMIREKSVEFAEGKLDAS